MKALIVLLATASISASAAPLPGTKPRSAEHRWWECHAQPSTGQTCCSEADGHVLHDDDWRMVRNRYQIRIDGNWFDVPPKAVIAETVRCGPEPVVAHRGAAKVWYAPLYGLDGRVQSVTLYCFLPGTMY